MSKPEFSITGRRSAKTVFYQLLKGVIISRHGGLYAGSKNASRARNSGDSTSDTGSMMATSTFLTRPGDLFLAAVRTWTAQSNTEGAQCTLLLGWWRVRGIGMHCLNKGHQPTCGAIDTCKITSGLAKGAVAGGGGEWLTAGDVVTCHKRRGIAGGLWWCVLLKLCRRQHVSYHTVGMAAAVHDHLFCGQHE